MKTNQPEADDEMLNQMTPNQRRALDKGLAALDTMAATWAAEVRLNEIAKHFAAIADPDERATRIAAMIRQGFSEGAYRHFLDHKDQIAALATSADQSASGGVPERLPGEKFSEWAKRTYAAAPAPVAPTDEREVKSPQTFAGFAAAHVNIVGRMPSEQEAFDAGVRAGLDRATPQATRPVADAAVTLSYPAEFTDELKWILGLICFQCIEYAKALRAGGHSIPNKAESEQAATLDWMLRHYMRDPENWRKNAADETRAMMDAARAKEPK
ncbi:hypothetical protein B0G81_6773 [Paraburkholderia sp. BL6665CI2N2]|uniref:hypothetical protein n=1 Tax=Paraburkholderia sp. BL6665CI2N2 TaxID=1938806 RepID=UPI001064C044|nr:hypothetical protein [Paraburkholderia sp. BL6665CI2N2]TDY26263.1 hypothetical protein B0G81_6773 [Paraburkholderia sp. BL6665CI2N2]